MGKSVSLRSRIRAHFSEPLEKRMCRQIQEIKTYETAGELGALLLESKLIKELHPYYNRQSRQKRRIIIALREISREGYYKIRIDAVDSIDPKETSPILGIFKTHTQAEEFLSRISKEHNLCLKYLGLEKTNRYCFNYHLKICRGACKGEEPADDYNARVERGFEERRIKAWPYNCPIIIEEKGNGKGESFIIDHWCLLHSFVSSDVEGESFSPNQHRFDYDSYKIISRYVFDSVNNSTIRSISHEEVSLMMTSHREK